MYEPSDSETEEQRTKRLRYERNLYVWNFGPESCQRKFRLDEPVAAPVPATMANVGYRSINELLTCPYNKSHQVAASKFPNHLVKCRKQYPELAKDMVICIYNQSHHILKKDMDRHLTTCEDYKADVLHNINTSGPSHFVNAVNSDLNRPTQEPSFGAGFSKEELDEWM